MDTELRQSIERYLRTELAAGFNQAEEIAADAQECWQDRKNRKTVAALIAELLPPLLVKREQDQKTWPAVTDCDRLDAAFEQLNSLGIMARHNFWCCGTCAAAAMPDEFENLDGQWEGVPITGYVYYHQQDTENAVQNRGVCLGFGETERAISEEDYQSKSVQVAKRAVEVLERHGLEVSWNGEYSERPFVQLNWQRRARPARFCEG